MQTNKYTKSEYYKVKGIPFLKPLLKIAPQPSFRNHLLTPLTNLQIEIGKFILNKAQYQSKEITLITSQKMCIDLQVNIQDLNSLIANKEDQIRWLQNQNQKYQNKLQLIEKETFEQTNRIKKNQYQYSLTIESMRCQFNSQRLECQEKVHSLEEKLIICRKEHQSQLIEQKLSFQAQLKEILSSKGNEISKREEEIIQMKKQIQTLVAENNICRSDLRADSYQVLQVIRRYQQENKALKQQLQSKIFQFNFASSEEKMKCRAKKEEQIPSETLNQKQVKCSQNFFSSNRTISEKCRYQIFDQSLEPTNQQQKSEQQLKKYSIEIKDALSANARLQQKVKQLQKQLSLRTLQNIERDLIFRQNNSQQKIRLSTIVKTEQKVMENIQSQNIIINTKKTEQDRIDYVKVLKEQLLEKQSNINIKDSQILRLQRSLKEKNEEILNLQKNTVEQKQVTAQRLLQNKQVECELANCTCKIRQNTKLREVVNNKSEELSKENKQLILQNQDKTVLIEKLNRQISLLNMQVLNTVPKQPTDGRKIVIQSCSHSKYMYKSLHEHSNLISSHFECEKQSEGGDCILEDSFCKTSPFDYFKGEIKPSQKSSQEQDEKSVTPFKAPQLMVKSCVSVLMENNDNINILFKERNDLSLKLKKQQWLVLDLKSQLQKSRKRVSVLESKHLSSKQSSVQEKVAYQNKSDTSQHFSCSCLNNCKKTLSRINNSQQSTPLKNKAEEVESYINLTSELKTAYNRIKAYEFEMSAKDAEIQEIKQQLKYTVELHIIEINSLQTKHLQLEHFLSLSNSKHELQRASLIQEKKSLQLKAKQLEKQLIKSKNLLQRQKQDLLDLRAKVQQLNIEINIKVQETTNRQNELICRHQNYLQSNRQKAQEIIKCIKSQYEYKLLDLQKQIQIIIEEKQTLIHQMEIVIREKETIILSQKQTIIVQKQNIKSEFERQNAKNNGQKEKMEKKIMSLKQNYNGLKRQNKRLRELKIKMDKIYSQFQDYDQLSFVVRQRELNLSSMSGASNLSVLSSIEQSQPKQNSVRQIQKENCHIQTINNNQTHITQNQKNNAEKVQKILKQTKIAIQSNSQNINSAKVQSTSKAQKNIEILSFKKQTSVMKVQSKVNYVETNKISTKQINVLKASQVDNKKHYQLNSANNLNKKFFSLVENKKQDSPQTMTSIRTNQDKKVSQKFISVTQAAKSTNGSAIGILINRFQEMSKSQQKEKQMQK